VSARTWNDFRTQARQTPARIILADGEDSRVIEAAARAQRESIANPILIGSKARILPQWIKFAGTRDIPYLDMAELSDEEKDHLTDVLLQLAKFKSLSRTEARDRLHDPLILGCLYLREHKADGFVGGATRTTADTLKAVFSVVGLAGKAATLFGFFLIQQRSSDERGRLVILADCAVTIDPSAKQLANIAIGAADAYTYFLGGTAKVAFLSFSTAGSATHPMVDKVRQAVAMTHEKAPSLDAVGEWQADAALDLFSARSKGVGGSKLAGQANVLIAPDLNCGNIAYKLVQRLGGCRSVGPILWGTAQPANDLSRGCSTEDVLDMLALTTLQTQKTMKAEKLTYGL
jgi:phosphate acetyltransferase